MENILRVEAGRIDNVLNLVGELIIGKSMLQQALSEFSKRYPKELLRGKFADAMGFQARVLNDLQRSVMKIRMVPVEQLFRRAIARAQCPVHRTPMAAGVSMLAGEEERLLDRRR